MLPNKRRKFLAVAAVTAATMGLPWKSFGARSGNRAFVSNTEDDGNVKHFGAIGDGKADDTKAIQRAIDSGQGDIYFPKGIYRITKTLEIALDKIGHSSINAKGGAQIIMAGSGPAFRVSGTHFKSAAPGTFEQSVWDRERMPMFSGLAIVGDHPDAVGIETTGTMQLTMHRLHIRKTLHGIHVTGNNRNLIISDCHIYENRGIGIFYDEVNLHQSNITGCHVSYNDGGGIASIGGNVRNLHITGCDIESNMGKDTSPTANVLIDCSSSRAGTAEVAITGCTIQHNSVGPDSANIRILGRSKVGAEPRPERWGNVTITGNILSDVMVNLHLRDCRGVAISGNTIWEGYQHNLLMEGCSNIVMGANIFDFNPNYQRSMKAKNRMMVSDCEDCTFSGFQINHVYGTAGLHIENSRRINLSNCTILDCEKVGVVLKDVSDSRVSGLLIKNAKADSGFIPMKVDGGEGNWIEEGLLT